MSTFTANLDLELVARNADTGVWDTPTNNNWNVVDLAVGGITVITLNNSNIILSAAQFQASTLVLNSTLTGNVTLTFPTSYIKSYNVFNTCTGSSAFTVSLATASTAAGAQSICAPPGTTVSIFNDSANMRYMSLPPVGTYVDYAGSNVPNWVSGCTVAPFLICTGQSFSSVTYPTLASILGGTTTPDRRGTVAVNLDQGAGRLTNFGGIFAVAGDQNLQGHVHNVSGNTGNESANHAHAYTAPISNTNTGGGVFPCAGPITTGILTGTENTAHTHAMNFNSQTTGAGNGQNVQPTTIIGITMIRAA